jgi:predicted dinucleotide-utilizing enzyme
LLRFRTVADSVQEGGAVAVDDALVIVLVPPVEVIARKGRKAGRFSGERVVEGRAVVFHGEVPSCALLFPAAEKMHLNLR